MTIVARPRVAPTLIGDGSPGSAWFDRLGSLGITDRLNLLEGAGYGWHTHLGTNVTPIQGGGAGTVFDLEQSEMSWAIPSGVCMIPLRMKTVTKRPLAAADNETSEILLVVDRTSTLSTASASTGTVKTPTNMRTDIAQGSLLTVVSANTSDHNTPVLSQELDREFAVLDFAGTPATILWGTGVQLYEPKIPPLLIGPCSLFVYFGGTVAHTGYGQYQWLELPSAIATSLFGLG